VRLLHQSASRAVRVLCLWAAPPPPHTHQGCAGRVATPHATILGRSRQDAWTVKPGREADFGLMHRILNKILLIYRSNLIMFQTSKIHIKLNIDPKFMKLV
jgi:hypothetical protein